MESNSTMSKPTKTRLKSQAHRSKRLLLDKVNEEVESIAERGSFENWRFT